MLKIEFCSHCLEEIEEFGEIVSILYTDICKVYSFQKCSVCVDPSRCQKPTCTLDIIHLLERKGYVKTAEGEGSIIKVIPIGHSEIEACEPTHTFCAKNHSRFC